MNIDAISMTTASPPRVNEPARQVERNRQAPQDQPQATPAENKVQPEELLQQIKSIAEEGSYSVRFEQDDKSQELIVKIVDRETDEVIRQFPPEELLNLSKQLQELSGNIVNTVS